MFVQLTHILFDKCLKHICGIIQQPADIGCSHVLCERGCAGANALPRLLMVSNCSSERQHSNVSRTPQAPRTILQKHISISSEPNGWGNKCRSYIKLGHLGMHQPTFIPHALQLLVTPGRASQVHGWQQQLHCLQTLNYQRLPALLGS